jgi:hypothetical protein
MTQNPRVWDPDSISTEDFYPPVILERVATVPNDRIYFYSSVASNPMGHILDLIDDQSQIEELDSFDFFTLDI